MSIIAFVNQKGGCGKSTTAYHCAYWLKKKGYNVLLVDADAQQSSSKWTQRSESGIESKIISTFDDLLNELPALAKTYDHVVVDGPAGLAEPTKAIMLSANVAIIPCQPSGADIESASEAIRVINIAKNYRSDGFPKAAIFLSRTVKNTRLTKEATALFQTYESISVLKSQISNRQVVQDTYGQAATVWDLRGTGANDAAREYEVLFSEIIGMVNNVSETKKAFARNRNR